MSTILVPEVGFAGGTTTHLIRGKWSYDYDNNFTVCGRKATAVGYYQIGMAEVTCVSCTAIHAKEQK